MKKTCLLTSFFVSCCVSFLDFRDILNNNSHHKDECCKGDNLRCLAGPPAGHFRPVHRAPVAPSLASRHFGQGMRRGVRPRLSCN